MTDALQGLDPARALTLEKACDRPTPLSHHMFSGNLEDAGITSALLDEHGVNHWLGGPAQAAWSVFHLDTFQNMIYDSWLASLVDRAALSDGRPVLVVLNGGLDVELDALDGDHRCTYGLFGALPGTVDPTSLEGHTTHVGLVHNTLGTLSIPLEGITALLVQVDGRWYGDL